MNNTIEAEWNDYIPPHELSDELLQKFASEEGVEYIEEYIHYAKFRIQYKTKKLEMYIEWKSKPAFQQLHIQSEIYNLINLFKSDIKRLNDSITTATQLLENKQND